MSAEDVRIIASMVGETITEVSFEEDSDNFELTMKSGKRFLFDISEWLTATKKDK